jgi:hypothetical protein
VSPIDCDSTSKAAVDLARIRPPAEFRAATDIVSPIAKYSDLANEGVTLGRQTLAGPLHFDSWLFETLFVIESYRKVADGWDGHVAVAPTKHSLDAAEMLSAFLALSREEKRPTLCVDAIGRPTFATNAFGFYIHLTVDQAGRLTWYSVSDGIESFADDVDFDGHRLPAELESLFSA